MSDTIRQIALVVFLVFVGMLAGIAWHAHGGQWWVIPLLAFAVPLVVFVGVFIWAFFAMDWSH